MLRACIIHTINCVINSKLNPSDSSDVKKYEVCLQIDGQSCEWVWLVRSGGL